jgi:hypothetical protein
MTTTILIPDDLFEDAERLACRLKIPRSRLYARAVAEFVARHDDDHVTSTMNQVVDEIAGVADDFVRETARRSLQRVEWCSRRQCMADRLAWTEASED